MRLPVGGMVDRDKAVSFRFDGRVFSGFQGDTLASALLANDVRLMGRSFKYHRPRGVLTAGSEEPNALVGVGEGARHLPNTRATMQEIYDGLVAVSQNRWPSLKFDAMAVNDALSPFLSAGFYYKTFMWPRSFWERVYEPLIRRAAGLGRLSGLPDPEVYDKAWAFCDVFVIGAGPAGLSAALTAARWGAKVILAEEDFTVGGRLNGEILEIGDQSGLDWGKSAIAELEAMPNVRVMRRTCVTGAYDGGSYGALQRVSDHLADRAGRPDQTFWRIVAKRAILAGGSHERMIAFPGNDRPGVMLAGAVRTYLHRFGVAAGSKVAVFTNNDDGHKTARDLRAAGVRVTALIDTRPDVVVNIDCPVYAGGQVISTSGRLGLTAISVRKAEGGIARIDCDCLAVSGGWNPAVHLACHMNGKPVWREDIAAFMPVAGMVPGMQVAGAANGAFSTHAALAEGEAAARAALEFLGRKVAKSELPKAEDAPVAVQAFWQVKGARGRAWLDFQNDVTTKDLELAHRENFRSVEHMKRYTTLGMSTDQGKIANVTGLAVMAELTGRTIAETGTTTYRPPYTSTQIGAFAGRAVGKDFAPERFTPAHGFAVERNALMLEAGLWYRAAYFPRVNEAHWRESCDREVGFVRNAVGVCDVTTLGKIDLQGPDAAEFLDRVYSNMFSTLKVGRVRYGLMLREDGFVMDDGTSARLGENHFLMTTTTAAAGPVMSHLEFCAQCLWPELDVQFISVTEQWAQFSIAGPKARDLVQGICREVISNVTFPYMGCGKVSVGGVAGRLFRISFSGEHAYEIAVPARYGDALMRELVTRAEAMGGGAYGLEALNVLRIEKGHITHAEIHGRTTAVDCGLAKMVSDKKDCIGKAMSSRVAMVEPGRDQLVGLKPVASNARLHAGAHFAGEGVVANRLNDQGYMTSVCYSPTLGQMIGLGFVKDGHLRMGQRIRACDPLRGIETLCEITPVCFIDPEGERVRG